MIWITLTELTHADKVNQILHHRGQLQSQKNTQTDYRKEIPEPPPLWEQMCDNKESLLSKENNMGLISVAGVKILNVRSERALLNFCLHCQVQEQSR